MNNAINWMIENAQQTETLEDGTVSHFFNGTIPARMRREIIEAASVTRNTNKSSAYSADGETWGWSAVFGARKSNQNRVRFSYNDYTIPAGA